MGALSVLIIVGVILFAVGILGSGDYVQIKIPPMPVWARVTFGVAGSACVVYALILIGNSSPNRGTAAPVQSQSKPVTTPSVTPSTPSPTGVKAASAQITSPRTEAQISRGSGVIIKGTAENLDGKSLWIFTQSDGVYYVDNPYPILVDSGKWQFDDPYIGSGGAGAYVINAILANPSCTKAMQSAKPQPGGGIAFQTLPGGCSIGDKVVVDINP
jgi:hypothetical protein